jgi:protein-disulfide isomerase
MTTTQTVDSTAVLTERDHVRGSRRARVTLIEYGDFDCPYCVQAFPLVRKLTAEFAGELRLVFRHNPRGAWNESGRLAARAAEAAGLQGQFWPMHDLLFERSRRLSEVELRGYASALRLDLNLFDAHLHAPAVLERVRQDQLRGLRSGVVGTPSFFINGQHYERQVDYEPMRAAIQSVLDALPRPAKKPVRRRDATGHLDPRYQALLLKQSGRSGDADQTRAFFARARSADDLAERLGEEAVEAATGGGEEAEDRFDEVVPEENGGPFVETSSEVEFAAGTDASNIAGAKREPFPKT